MTVNTISVKDGELTIYRFDTITFANASVNERYSNRIGVIKVPGNVGDVWALDADQNGDDVTLTSVQFRTYFGETLDESEVLDLIQTTLYHCYRSIGSDTFIPTRE
jgi:hypothetical protein